MKCFYCGESRTPQNGKLGEVMDWNGVVKLCPFCNGTLEVTKALDEDGVTTIVTSSDGVCINKLKDVKPCVSGSGDFSHLGIKK